MCWVSFVALFSIVAVWLISAALWLIDDMHYWLSEDWCLFYVLVTATVIWFLAKQNSN
jgi:hypothetical protein